MKESWVKKIRYIFQEDNKCADFLANLAPNCQDGRSILVNPPIDLLPLLEKDVLGQSSIRSWPTFGVLCTKKNIYTLIKIFI